MKFWKRFRDSLAKRICNDKPGNPSIENHLPKSIEEAIASTKKDPKRGSSDHVEETFEYDDQHAAEKVRRSGLCFKPLVRKALNCHYQFLCWLPDAAKKTKDEGLNETGKREEGKDHEKQEDKSSSKGEEGGNNQEGSQEGSNDQQGIKDQDARMCLVKATSIKPGEEKVGSSGRNEDRMLYELTASEWETIQNVRKSLGVDERGG